METQARKAKIVSKNYTTEALLDCSWRIIIKNIWNAFHHTFIFSPDVLALLYRNKYFSFCFWNQGFMYLYNVVMSNRERMVFAVTREMQIVDTWKLEGGLDWIFDRIHFELRDYYYSEHERFADNGWLLLTGLLRIPKQITHFFSFFFSTFEIVF